MSQRAARAADLQGAVSGRGRRLPVGVAVLGVALLAAGGALLAVAARGPAPPQTLQDRVRAIASTLRCPVCQDLSVADSPSALAGQMRARIAGELRAGRGPDQIRQGFVSSYGDWILLAPPRRGINLVAWWAPALLLATGLVAAGAAVRRWTDRPGAGLPGPVRAEPSASELSAEDRRLLDLALSALEDPDEPEDPEGPEGRR